MAEPCRVGFQLWSERRRCGKMRRRRDRAFAGESKARLDRRPVTALVGKPEAEHDRLARDCLGKYLVIVRKFLGQGRIDPGDLAHDITRRQPIRLRKENVECNGRSAHLRKPVHQQGQPVSWPRPLAEFA